MKILHIIGTLEMGGAESLLVSLTAEQKRHGNDVSVLLLREAKDPTVTNNIRANGIHVYWLTENGSIYSVKHIWLLRSWIRGSDIVHVHLFPSFYWVGIAHWFTPGAAPLVYTEHSTSNRRMNNPILNLVDRLIYRSSFRHIIACSPMVEECFRKAYPDVKCISTIANGIDIKAYRDTSPYTKQELLGISENSFVVTMVARFMYPKRQDTIVEAIARLPENYHCCFVGGHAEDEPLLKVKQLAEDKNVCHRVHFLLVRSDIARILKTSDVVVLSSEYEGLSLSSIEGMAAGRPFLATDVTGLREIVGGYGKLFPVGDSKTLADLLSQLYSDSNYYNEVAARCSKRAADFDISKMERGYMNIYERVIKKK